ncbi:MAG: hypothetical protein CMM90_00325 [Rickettsiales bacterium]|nr:hypothetical protein [Rickettsiales bacterium]|tara:strand:+ start:993 stop:1568 length:576 start_codon:yes stop_codon:yes gene_type:complete
MIVINEILNIILYVFFNIPGITGIKIRQVILKFFFLETQAKIILHQSAEIRSIKNINFEGLVSFQKRCFISAVNAKLIIGKNTHFNLENLVIADGGEITIGSNCIFGPRVIMRSVNHKYENKNINIIDQGHKYNKILIEDDVWIGAGSIILPGSIIRRGSVISAGSVVRGETESYGVYSSYGDLKKIRSRS